MATTESSAVREFKSSVRRELLEGNLSANGAPKPTPEAPPKMPPPIRQRAARGTPSPEFNVPPLMPRPRATLPPPIPKPRHEGETPAFANRTLESNPPPLPRSQSPKLRDLPTPRRSQAKPPPLPPPLPRAALTVSLEPTKRPTVKAASELVFPPHLESESVDSDADTPPIDIPTLGPDRPNLHVRPAERKVDEATETIAPIPSRPSRANYIIAALCAAGVVGAAGVVLYATLGGRGKGKAHDARAAVAQAQTLEVAPTVTPIVEPIPTAAEAPVPVASVLPLMEAAPPAKHEHHSASATRRSTEPAPKALAAEEKSKPAAVKSKPAAAKPEPADVKSKPAAAKPKAAAATSADDEDEADGDEAEVASSKEPARETSSAQPAAELGVLMLGSKPPCAIHIDGRDTGLETPQRSIELASGTHEVSLVNETYDIREKFSVKIKPGDKTRVIKDMSDRLGD